jgi:UDP-N-acetyl-D-mannosaminuronate dehydrogenase
MNNIGIIGVGKLGLPYALVFERAGFNVMQTINH